MEVVSRRNGDERHVRPQMLVTPPMYPTFPRSSTCCSCSSPLSVSPALSVPRSNSRDVDLGNRELVFVGVLEFLGENQTDAHVLILTIELDRHLQPVPAT